MSVCLRCEVRRNYLGTVPSVSPSCQQPPRSSKWSILLWTDKVGLLFTKYSTRSDSLLVLTARKGHPAGRFYGKFVVYKMFPRKDSVFDGLCFSGKYSRAKRSIGLKVSWDIQGEPRAVSRGLTESRAGSRYRTTAPTMQYQVVSGQFR